MSCIILCMGSKQLLIKQKQFTRVIWNYYNILVACPNNMQSTSHITHHINNQYALWSRWNVQPMLSLTTERGGEWCQWSSYLKTKTIWSAALDMLLLVAEFSAWSHRTKFMNLQYWRRQKKILGGPAAFFIDITRARLRIWVKSPCRETKEMHDSFGRNPRAAKNRCAALLRRAVPVLVVVYWTRYSIRTVSRRSARSVPAMVCSTGSIAAPLDLRK